MPRTAQSVHDILRSDGLRTYFQPILSVRQRRVIGVEALTRATSADGDLDAGSLFRMASDEGTTARLEQACCERALAAFSSASKRRDDLILFLNLGSWVAVEGETALDRLTDLVWRAHVPASHVAIEILEAKVENVGHLTELVRRLHRTGFLVVLDDVGAGHSNLDRIPLLKPDVIKVDRGLVAAITSDFHKQETLKSLVGLSRRIGARVVAEGIENEDEAISALELGADFIQGYYVGRPSPATDILSATPADTSANIDGLAERFKSYMVGKINQRKLQHRRYNIVLNEVLCHLGAADPDGFDDALTAAVAKYPSVECVYVLDSAGAQVTDTIWNPAVAPRVRGLMFQPAPRGTDHSLKEYYYVLLDVELQKFTTDPYLSFASGNLGRTISTYFRDVKNSLYILCMDVLEDEDAGHRNGR